MRRPILSYCGHRHDEPRPGAPALALDGVSVSYPDSTAPALRELTIEFPVGARVAIVGPNGSGKSTLLKAAAGLLRPGLGQVRVLGHAPDCLHHRIAYLPQRSDLDWHFPISVRRLVLTGRFVHLGWLRRPRRRDWDIVDAALDRMRVSDLAKRQIGRLSGGQQQRVLLARALAQQADLFLLDEPLNAIDAATRKIVAGVLDGLRAAGKTALVATHDLGHLESDFDAAIYLSEGRLTQPPPGSFRGRPPHPGAAWTG